MGHAEYHEDHGVWKLGWYYPDAEYDGDAAEHETEVGIRDGTSFSGGLADAFVAYSRGTKLPEVAARYGAACAHQAEERWAYVEALKIDPSFVPKWAWSR